MLIDILAAAPAAFDPEAATRAYLDTLQGAARARSDAYFEGGLVAAFVGGPGQRRRGLSLSKPCLSP